MFDLSPPMIAVLCLVVAVVVVVAVMHIYGNRLTLMSKLPGATPDSFKEKKEDKKPEPEYPQEVVISGYDIKPQPYMMDVSNKLVDLTKRKVCAVEPNCCQ